MALPSDVSFRLCVSTGLVIFVVCVELLIVGMHQYSLYKMHSQFANRVRIVACKIATTIYAVLVTKTMLLKLHPPSQWNGGQPVIRVQCRTVGS
eukprot:SAG31_NODE_12242_length_956_cov_1.206534_1_plen_93_part_10